MSYSANTLSLLFIGRPTSDKGLPDLLEALSRLGSHNWNLRVCGELLPESDVDLALPPGRVSFMGPWPNSSIPAIIKESHLVVIPSRYENFCNVALEALAAGRAALGSRCGGLPDLIKPEFNGLLFEPASPPDLAVKLTRCFRNPDDVVAWGANGFEQSRRYGWEEVAEETHVLFVRIIARRAAEPTRGLEDGSRGDSRK